MSLVGEDYSEQKEFSIRAFLGDLNIRKLNIIGSAFSLALGNAGLDNPNTHYGFLNEFPGSIPDLAQLYGRFGRRRGASPNTDALDIRCDLDGYLAMYMRIIFSLQKIKTSKSNMKESERRGKEDLQAVIALLVLRRGCIHARIANYICCPGSFKYDPFLFKCRSCTSCGNDWDKLFLPVRYRPVFVMLSSYLIMSGNNLDIHAIVDRIWKNKTKLTSIFIQAQGNIRKHHISSLVMQLLACGIIQVRYSAVDKKFFVDLQLDTIGIPIYQNIANFVGMNVQQ